MNARFQGDSYDLVKRFFCVEIKALGLRVLIDPMSTGEWRDDEASYLRLIGASPIDSEDLPEPSALFLDPDTGVNENGSKAHVSFSRIAEEAKRFSLVFAFDQSFSRNQRANDIMTAKMKRLQSFGCHSFYYDSHARFLFSSREERVLKRIRERLIELGIPDWRVLNQST